MSGIAVNRSGKWFSWKLGLDLWEFRQWPEEALHCNGKSLSGLAKEEKIKMVEEAVIFTKGYYQGIRQGWRDTIEAAMKG